MSKSVYKFVSMDELKKNKEKLTFIWPGRIAKNAITILSAPGDSGKSALLLFLANKFAGEGWKVLVIDAEGCTEHIKSRIETWNLPHISKVKIAATKKKYKNKDEEENEDIETGSSDDFAEMVPEILKEKPDLVIIDSLTEIGNSHDLNNAKSVGILQTQFKKIQQNTGAGLLLISHNRKPGQGEKAQTRTAEVYGAQKITAKSRSVLMIEKKKEVRIIKHTKGNLAGLYPDVSFKFSKTGELINFKELTPKESEQYGVDPITKADKIRKKAKSMLESGEKDWVKIRKSICSDKGLNASSKEVKRVYDAFVKEGIIITKEI